MNKLTRLFLITIISLSSVALFSTESVSAKGVRGKITGKTVVGGLLSLLIWPGIGQAVNDNKGDKVVTHAVIGLLPPFRFWSGYDALYDRQGGYWKERI
jgi:hypothetical protein